MFMARIYCFLTYNEKIVKNTSNYHQSFNYLISLNLKLETNFNNNFINIINLKK